jgi:formyl-CoA transferase
MVIGERPGAGIAGRRRDGASRPEHGERWQERCMIKILEIANYISGPFASVLLADLGAEVTKVEMPGHGDPFRGWGDNAYSPTFCNFNRNKRSLSLNVQLPEGKEICMRLARNADVLIENMRPGVLDQLGLGYEAVREVNPSCTHFRFCLTALQ